MNALVSAQLRVMNQSNALWQAYLQRCQDRLTDTQLHQICGRVTRVAGLVMEVAGLKLAIGSPCYIPLGKDYRLDVEVVGFGNERLYLMPLGDVEGVKPGALVFPNFPRPSAPRLFADTSADADMVFHGRRLPVGKGLLGRVVDATGKPLDSKGPILTTDTAALYSQTINPLQRAPIEQP